MSDDAVVGGAIADTTETQKVNKDEDLARYQRYVRSFTSNKSNELKERQTAFKYYHDKQWTDKELATLKRRKQPPVTDNALKRKIDFLVGIEQRLRRDPKAYPRKPQREEDSDAATAGLRFVCDQNRWDKISSKALRDGLVGGIGVAWIGIKPSRMKPQQPGSPQMLDVSMSYVDPTRFIYDPRSIMHDFSDAKWSGIDLWEDIDEACEDITDPKIEKQLRSTVNSQSGSLSTMISDQDKATQWADYEHRRVRIVEIYELRPLQPGQPAVWYYCKFSGNLVIDCMVSPYQDEFGNSANPYNAWSPYVDEKGDRYGPTRTIKPIQDAINHSRSKFQHELNARQTYSNTPGAVDDVDKLREQVARPDGHLEFGAGEWGKTVGIIDRSKELKGHFDLLQDSQQRIENFGPNPGLVGRGGGVADQSGRAILAQRDSGMTELSPVFEEQRDWKLRAYRSMWGRIRQAWTTERWIAIVDDPKKIEHMPINQYQMGQHPVTGMPTIVGKNIIAQIDVDIILEEGPDMVVMREELLQTISQMGPAALGPMGKVLIELSNVANKDELIQILDDAAQPPPMVAELQARMAQLEALLKSSTVDKNTASAANDRASALQKLVQALQGTPAQTDKVTGFVTQEAQPPNWELAMKLLAAFEQIPPEDQGNPQLPPPAPPGGPPGAPPGPPQGGPPGMPPGSPGPPRRAIGPPGRGKPMMPPQGGPEALPPDATGLHNPMLSANEAFGP